VVLPLLTYFLCADFDELFAIGRPKTAINEATAAKFVQVKSFGYFRLRQLH